MFTRPTWIWCLALTYREEHCMFVLVMECLRVLFWALCFLLFMFHLSAEQSWRWFWPSGSAELPLVSPVCFSSLLVVCLSLSVCQCRLRLGVADLHSAHLLLPHLRSIYTDHQLPVFSRSFPSRLHQIVVKPSAVTPSLFSRPPQTGHTDRPVQPRLLSHQNLRSDDPLLLPHFEFLDVCLSPVSALWVQFWTQADVISCMSLVSFRIDYWRILLSGHKRVLKVFRWFRVPQLELKLENVAILHQFSSSDFKVPLRNTPSNLSAVFKQKISQKTGSDGSFISDS